MPVTAGARDPRSIITPDAFEVSDDLLGRPLATPRQRFVAIAIDMVVVGVITMATKSFGVLLGIVAAIFFVRAGFKRTPVRGSAFDRAMRFSVGCLGLFIALVTAATWGIVRAARHDSDGDTPGVSVPGVVTGAGQLGDVLSMIGGSATLARADDADQAAAAASRVVERLRGLGMGDEEIRRSVLDIIPHDKSWSHDATAIVDSVLNAAAHEAPASPAPEMSTEVAALSTEQALTAYADLLHAGAADDASGARLQALRSRILDSLAADTIKALQQEARAAQRLAESRSRQRDHLEEALKAEQEKQKQGGFFGWINNVANGLGFGIGWASLYFAIILSWWQGQTVGKRMMKIRVLRLDGEPITWYTAFERAGGYAAGFATGFLGFAQVYWDANRQAIHDRIVGTVVVQDGAPKVTDWRDAV